ncbi:hypothetical protein A8926_6785 [Saccharopolyspora spinosa]|uniref:Uncharacterized protein n=1 Tax=Saccharopolyspora spinosa TaxID=60894 RepID=A0A2N3Y6W5_SACSN|nr:hypothetical protein A8926_6785 [Saccharopolyspora spinosa]
MPAPRPNLAPSVWAADHSRRRGRSAGPFRARRESGPAAHHTREPQTQLRDRVPCYMTRRRPNGSPCRRSGSVSAARWQCGAMPRAAWTSTEVSRLTRSVSMIPLRVSVPGHLSSVWNGGNETGVWWGVGWAGTERAPLRRTWSRPGRGFCRLPRPRGTGVVRGWRRRGRQGASGRGGQAPEPGFQDFSLEIVAVAQGSCCRLTVSLHRRSTPPLHPLAVLGVLLTDDQQRSLHGSGGDRHVREG